jgi:hypothetical protein
MCYFKTTEKTCSNCSVVRSSETKLYGSCKEALEGKPCRARDELKSQFSRGACRACFLKYVVQEVVEREGDDNPFKIQWEGKASTHGR